jgi:hypothetical protein
LAYKYFHLVQAEKVEIFDSQFAKAQINLVTWLIPLQCPYWPGKKEEMKGCAEFFQGFSPFGDDTEGRVSAGGTGHFLSWGTPEEDNYYLSPHIFLL